MAGLPSDSSGSEYDVYRDLSQGLESSDEEVSFSSKMSRNGSRPKKTRFEAVPSYAKSTPKDDIYAFSGEEEEAETERFIRKRPSLKDWRETPTTSQKNITLTDLMNKLTTMEAKLLGAIQDLRTDNENLRKGNRTQATKIVQLAGQVQQLETHGLRHTEQDTQAKASNHLRAALRAALKHAAQEKGMDIQINDGLDSASNKKIVEHIKSFAKVHVPDMTEVSFRAALKTIIRSKKQAVSRQKGGKEEHHSNIMRKVQRKAVKSQNRVFGLEACDLPVDLRKKYRAALMRPALMSSEESDVDEIGEKVLMVRSRNWESQELRKVKRLADKNYGKSRRPKTPRLRRVEGPVSTTQAPRNLNPEEGWSITNYGDL